MTGRKGGSMMLASDGYRYRILSRCARISRIYWCCILYDRKTVTKCQVRLVTQGDSILNQFGEHNHEPCWNTLQMQQKAWNQWKATDWARKAGISWWTRQALIISLFVFQILAKSIGNVPKSDWTVKLVLYPNITSLYSRTTFLIAIHHPNLILNKIICRYIQLYWRGQGVQHDSIGQANVSGSKAIHLSNYTFRPRFRQSLLEM